MKTSLPFTGFTTETVLFFQELEKNNNKEWFEAHKEDYKKYVVEPLKALSESLATTMLSIDPYFEVTPYKTISRIYRDTRFSKNKHPYKTCMWISFKRNHIEWQDSPVYFFEVSGTGYIYGMGFYQATPDTLRAFRKNIDENEKMFEALVDEFESQKIFYLSGEKYKKTFDATKSAKIQNWYQRKNIAFICEKSMNSNLFSKKLVDELQENFLMLKPFYKFFQNITASK